MLYIEPFGTKDGGCFREDEAVSKWLLFIIDIFHHRWDLAAILYTSSAIVVPYSLMY